MISSYERADLCLHTGLMLREAIRREGFARWFLQPEGDLLARLFALVALPNFDQSSDAFATLRDLLTRHTQLVAVFLWEQWERIVPSLNTLLASDNYVTRRQTIKLMGELLAANPEWMVRYVQEVEHLKLIMNLLRDKSRSIRRESFAVFKLFATFPAKPPAIQEVLAKNRDRLISHLQSGLFEGEEGEKNDKVFEADRHHIVALLQQLNTVERRPQPS